MANKFTYLKSGLSFTPLSQPPLNPVSGDVYYDLNLATHRVFTNGKWFNLVRSETDLGPTNASVIIVDLDLGQSQKLTVVPDQRYITFRPIDGVIGNTYRVRLVFDDSANFVTPINFHPVMQFASGSNTQVFATPGGSCVLNITPTASGYTATIESYAGYTYLHSISALPDSMGEENYTSAYISEGRLYLWGDSGSGQFGDGTAVFGITRAVPGPPLNSDKLWGRVSVGGASVIAIESSTGLAWAWGSNSSGKLGTGTTAAVSTPASVSGGRSWKQISVGLNFSVGIEASTGLAWAWGSNVGGALGNQDIIDASSPVSVLGGRSFSQIFTAYQGVLALEASTGNAYAWGNNGYGQLGVGSLVNYSSPVSVFGGRSFSTVTTGSSEYGSAFAAIEGSTGNAYAWGNNGYGVLGVSSTVNYSSPVSVFGGRSFSKIAAATGAMAAIEGSTGYAWAWGFRSYLGSGATSNASSPVSVLGGRSFSDIKANKGLTQGFYAYEGSTPTFYVWGAALGYRHYNTRYSQLTAVDPALHGARSWSQITVGSSCSAAIEGSTGNAYTWGLGEWGELGQASLASSYSPVSVFGGRSFSQIIVGGQINSNKVVFLALEGSTGRAWSWGYGADGKLGIGSYFPQSSPVSVQSTVSWKQVGAGNSCSVALEGSTGRAYTWGTETFGSLGTNVAQTSQPAPVSVAGARSWSQVAIGDGTFISAIEGSTGYVWGWGYGGNYSLGNGLTANTSSPVSVLGGRSFKQIAVQMRGAVAAIEASTGYVFTWGSNGLTTTPGSPEVVATQKSFSQVYATYQNFFAIEGSTGLLYWWGLQVSAAGASHAYSPERVGSLNKSFKQFPSGTSNIYSGIAIDPYNIIYFWGSAQGRQLGLSHGETDNSYSASSPVSVARFYTKF